MSIIFCSWFVNGSSCRLRLMYADSSKDIRCAYSSTMSFTQVTSLAPCFKRANVP
ncbi:hypothetical protein [Paenibacillus sp. GD4]|uniref:zinc finger domain-containing protein n=1 Tax=Paenibacillus sp. GD4 TaxID=3068890 RepID=UPI00358EB529